MKQAERSNSMPIVADGQERALAGAMAQLTERRAHVEAAIREKYAPLLLQAGMIRRFWLWLQMRFEIRRQMWCEKEKIAPTGALYAATGGSRKQQG